MGDRLARMGAVVQAGYGALGTAGNIFEIEVDFDTWMNYHNLRDIIVCR